MTGESGKVARVTVDHDLCVGVGMCIQFEPEGFRRGAAGLSEFVSNGEWSTDALMEAADACPMGAIAIIFESADTP